MHDPSKKYQELIEENSVLKQKFRELEPSEVKYKQTEEALRESEQNYRLLASYHRRLNDISIAFTESFSTEELFNKIAESLRLLCGATAATFAVYNPATQSLEPVSMSIDPTAGDTIRSVFGAALLKIRIPVSSDGMKQILNQFIRRPRDLYELSNEAVPRELSAAFIDAVGCWQIIALAVNYADELLGTCVAYLPEDQPMVPDDALKTYIYLSGMAIKRSRTEEILQESEKRYRMIVENMHESITTMDLNLNYKYQSPSEIHITGYTAEEIVQIPIKDMLTPESYDVMEKIITEEFEKELSGEPLDPHRSRNIEVEVHHKNGGTIWEEITASFSRDENGKPVEIMLVGRDISERKRAEESLRKSEENYRQLFNNAPSGIYQINFRTGKLLKANDLICEYIGCSQEEITSISVFDFLSPEGQQLFSERIIKMTSGEKVSEYPEFEIINRNGAKKWVQLNSKNFYDSEGMVIGADVIMHDITERKRAEEDLGKSKEMLSLITENMSDMIRLANLQGINLYVSPSHFKGLGYTVEERIGKPSLDIVHPDDIETINNKLLESFTSKHPVRIEYRVRHADGHYVWLETIADLLRDDKDNATAVVMSSRDVSDRKKTEAEKQILEERLNRAEKMEALGQLAGGVAHDLNNVLGALSGYSELLLMEIPEGQRARRHAEMIFQSTQRGAAIIQDLLTLARRGVTVSDVINLNDIIANFLKAPVFDNVRDYHPRVTFRTECDKNLLNIKGSPVHLEKTLLNLVSNAAESISGPGEVTIRTESRYLDKAIRGYDTIKEGDYAILTVSDTGMGISAEDREKMFEPFYTKKKMGRSGTGLGLAIVWGTVKDLNGYIDVQTKIGEGSTFSLYFPVSREEIIAPLQKMSIEQYMGKGESVLVIDDIAEQRDVASGLLTLLGYEVHTVSSGEEAVEYLGGNKADILVLDMIMAPGIDGLETYQRILKINPKQKAILVSGFSETDRVREAQKLGAGVYVKKPYVLEKIGMAIQDELKR